MAQVAGEADLEGLAGAVQTQGGDVINDLQRGTATRQQQHNDNCE